MLNNLAWFKATCINNSFYNPSEAFSLAQHASKLTKYREPRILDTLAVAQASKGLFTKAIETSEKAIKLTDSSGQVELAKDIRIRLELYKKSQPFQDSH